MANSSQLQGWTLSKDRSSFDILWSCCSTTFICVLIAQHNNVPENCRKTRSGRKALASRVLSLIQPNNSFHRPIPFRNGRSFWRLRPFWDTRRLQNLLPAFDDTSQRHRSPARQALRTKVRRFFLFLLVPEFLVAAAIVDFSDAYRFARKMRQNGCKRFNQKHAFFVCMGGFAFIPEGTTDRAILTKEHVMNLQGPLLDMIVEDMDHEIDDKNKLDIFAKLFACLQSSWLFIQIVTRWSINLPLAQLEITALTYVMCALAALILWFHKPRDVTSPILLPLSGQSRWERVLDDLEIEKKMTSTIIALTLGALPLFPPHIFAYTSLTFPTRLEKEIWFETSLILFITPFAWCVVFQLFPVNGWGHHVFAIFSIGVLVIFPCARLLFLGVSFSCLRAQPEGTYKAVWAQAWPHL